MRYTENIAELTLAILAAIFYHIPRAIFRALFHKK